MTDAISSLTSTGQQTASSVATSKLNTDYKSFLTLLTAQLTNQDPLEPMDSSTFVTQLAQLSQVEQAIQTNTNLESIRAQLSNAGLTNDLGLIGHEVSVPGDLFDLAGGKGTFDYVLDTAANDVSAVILNSAGQAVARIDDLPQSGATLHSVEWSGFTDEGAPVDDGIYQVQILATDPEGNTIYAEPYTKATVEGLTLQNGQSLLTLSNGGTALAGLVAAVN
ncbi:flagellar hook assembly protein FlgD [Pseudooceanicola sp.]|uniref:flagellar hook assembly protein FlgD n=1 Tax=Pseudooceanicola sp. TaxID=1914328 RepID=UPI0035C72BA6